MCQQQAQAITVGIKVITGRCASEDIGLERVDCEIPYRLERGTSVSKDTHFKNLEEKYRRESSRRTICASNEFRLLELISESDTGRCANEDIGLKGVDCEIPYRLERGTSVSENTGLKREMNCEISYRSERKNETFFIRVSKPFFTRRILKTLKGSP